MKSLNPNRRTILLLESGAGPGGSVNFLRDFVLYVDREKAEPLIGLYYRNSSPTLREIEDLGFRVTCFHARPHRGEASAFGGALLNRLGPLRHLRTLTAVGWRLLCRQLPLAWKLRSFIRREGVDVVVLNQDVHFHVSGVLAAALAGVPCVCRKAGGIGAAKRLKRILNRGVDLFVSISKATEDDQRQTPGTRRLLNIYEGLDLARFASVPGKSVIRRELGIRDSQAVVATISRVEEGKGHREFLRMAAAISPQYPSAVFLVVGDHGPEGGTLMGELKALVQQLGIEDRVIFTGWRNDIPAVMSAVDIFVHCPTTFIEGLARTCLEAMAMGIPSVVSDNGGMSDAVLDGVTGFVVPTGDVEAMVRSVAALLADPALASRLGLAARCRVEQVFDAAENARQLQEAILECARPKSGPAIEPLYSVGGAVRPESGRR